MDSNKNIPSYLDAAIEVDLATHRGAILDVVYESVAHTSTVGEGPTGYLDQPCLPEYPVVKGVDAHGRKFLTLCVEVRCSRDDGDPLEKETRVGVITVFQRYTDSDIIVQAQNLGNARLLESAASVNDMVTLGVLVRMGRAVFAFEDIRDRMVFRAARIVSPEEVRKGLKSMPHLRGEARKLDKLELERERESA